MAHNKPNLTYSAPILCVDLAADEYEIFPCGDCLPWHAEVIEEDGVTYVREWHAADCPTLRDLFDVIRGEI